MRHYYLIVLLFFTQSGQAQMYQWVDPATGTTQLSGKPPVWYRSAEGGPRVFVFDEGRVVDDTGIEISDEQRISLRTKAFVRAEEDRLAAKEKAIAAARLKAAMDRKADTSSGQDDEDTAVVDESGETLVKETPAEIETEYELSEEEVSVEKMRALIKEWENKRTEEARALLQKNDT